MSEKNILIFPISLFRISTIKIYLYLSLLAWEERKEYLWNWKIMYESKYLFISLLIHLGIKLNYFKRGSSGLRKLIKWISLNYLIFLKVFLWIVIVSSL